MEEDLERKNPDLKVIASLERTLRSCPHPSSFLWSEIFFYDDHETIANLVFGFGEDFITCALNDPASQLDVSLFPRTLGNTVET